jgi:thiamine-phosphate pyrophosphorylase
MSHLSYNLPKNFEILGSCHNSKEIKIKEIQKVNILFISSLFKKNKNFLGINKFKHLKSLTKKTVVALGGISKKNLNKLKLVDCKKFAGISYFE